MADEQAVEEQIEQEEVEQEVDAESAEVEAEESEDDGETELVVTLEGESPTPEEEQKQEAPEWVKELRKANREKERRIKELEQKLAQPVAETKPVAVGAKPKLEDFDYDADQYEAKLAEWFERKRSHDEAESKARAEQERIAEEGRKKVEAYQAEKSKLRVRDYDEAEMVVENTLSPQQVSILMDGLQPKDVALMVYAIGSNPKKAKELAAITNLSQYAIALGELKRGINVTNRKAPSPEKTVSGGSGGGISGTSMARLEEEARKTGDYTALLAARRKANSKS